MEYPNNGIGDNTKLIDENADGLMETYEETSTNSTDIESVNNALIELYEMINGGES